MTGGVLFMIATPSKTHWHFGLAMGFLEIFIEAPRIPVLKCRFSPAWLDFILLRSR